MDMCLFEREREREREKGYVSFQRDAAKGFLSHCVCVCVGVCV